MLPFLSLILGFFLREKKKIEGSSKKVFGVLREFTHVSTQIRVEPGTKTQKSFRGNLLRFGSTA